MPNGQSLFDARFWIIPEYLINNGAEHLVPWNDEMHALFVLLEAILEQNTEMNHAQMY